MERSAAPDEIKRKIDSFPYWHYRFELAGHHTMAPDRGRVNRHEQRKRYFFDPLVEVCGGSLKGKRVLDLGCNAGYWSLHATEAGADFVAGVDGRQMHVDQANFVFETKGIDADRYRFFEGNVFDLDADAVGRFDIVLCLGLLYHVAKPVELFEVISAVNNDLAIVDTNLSVLPGSYVRVRTETTEDPLHAADRELVTSPTKAAVVDMARAFGYSVVVLRPNFSDYTNAGKYRQGRRKAFICAKRTPLDPIRQLAEPERGWLRPTELFWLGRDNLAARAGRVRRRAV